MSVQQDKAITSDRPPQVVSGDGPSIGRFVALAAQLAVFVAVVYQLNIESPAFLRLMILTFFGWSVHYFLPRRYRLAFFLLLSFAGIQLVFGQLWEGRWYGGVVDGTSILVIGLALIGLCHLPVPIPWRAAALVLAGGALAAARSASGWVPWSHAIWPVLASMFMFRLIVYLYEIRREKKPASLTERLAYFFMLPNVCFPLFPVVDFQTFRRTYYDHRDRHYIYQTGILWLFRGAFHLILYRLVYYNLVIDGTEVQNRADLAQFLLWPFLLYLRISGTFHVICGLMHLFGFNLPETHKLYLLSSSFTDFWRRINIYWKDFIMTIFYYPLYFKLRRLGETGALVTATLLAFLATWLLHNYQWFWLRGTWIFTWNDFLFWMILAVLVAGNAVLEMRRGRTRRLQGAALSWRQALGSGLRTIGVYLTISVLWSLWSASSLAQWLSALGAAAVPSPDRTRLLLILAAVIVGIGVPAVALARGAGDQPRSLGRSAAAIGLPVAIAICASLPGLDKRLGPASDLIASAKRSELNRRDFANAERGYYESLVNIGGFNPELWQVYAARPREWDFLRNTELVRATGRLPDFEMLPGVSGRFHGASVRTNRWGMRDKEYEKTPGPNTLRIALLGSSHVFGDGVENEETFETLLEKRLNEVGGRYERYEILNFAVGGYSALDCMAVLEDKVFEFGPRYIFYVDVSGTVGRALRDVAAGARIPSDRRHDFLMGVLREAGIDDAPADEQMRKALLPQQARFLGAIYGRFVELARERGVPAYWILMPRVVQEQSAELQRRVAQEAGFRILDLAGAYDGYDPKALEVAPWDDHPNAVAHRLVADKFFEVLQRSEDTIPLGLAVRTVQE